jgi:hypothetical protein
MLVELPAMPSPALDVAHDDVGYSAELSIERDLAVREFDAFSDACLLLTPIVRRDGEHEFRGLVSVDEDTLWLYVHAMGPGTYAPERDAAARRLLSDLWRAIHEAAAVS